VIPRDGVIEKRGAVIGWLLPEAQRRSIASGIRQTVGCWVYLEYLGENSESFSFGQENVP
jgi:hypothetical protein